MLCTSILSEVVLGFMMWSGWLGISTGSEKTYPCPEYVQVPAGQEYGPPLVGTACPQACVGYPAPSYYPQPTPPYSTTAGVEVCKILSLPRHLAACDVKEVFNTQGATSMPCKKPCSWKIESVVKAPIYDGLEVEITLRADHCGVKEVYKTTKALVFDSVTDVTLEGAHPEPVCLRVVARRPAQPRMSVNAVVWGQPSQACNQPFLFNGMPMMPPMPYPVPAPLQPVAWNAGVSDPIPLNPPSPYTLPSPIVYPSSPIMTPVVHRASVKLVYEAGKSRLCVKSEGMTTECLRMKLETGAAGAVRLSAGKNHVHLVGNKWKAEADCIELGDDGRIVLAGHVKLTSDKLGVCAVVTADRVCVEVKGGKFEKIVASK